MRARRDYHLEGHTPIAKSRQAVPANATVASRGPAHQILQLQRALGNHKVGQLLQSQGFAQRQWPAGVESLRETADSNAISRAAFEQATSRPPGELPYRSTLERSFGTSFGGVQAHLGTDEAKSGLRLLGAQAAASGERIAFRDASPSLGLVAHEAAHVVQQRAAGGPVQLKALNLGAASGDAEARADAAAAAVVAGFDAPHVGTAPHAIYRALETRGGTWSTPTYSAAAAGTGVTGDPVGCQIKLHFTPNELVEAPAGGIGITQSVKSMKASTAHGANDTFAPPSDPGKAMVTLPAGSADPGRGMDRNIYPPDPAGPGGARAVPNTNPMYGVYNPAGGVATSLNAQTPSVGATKFGAHVRKADGKLDAAVDAVLEDSPSRRLEFDKQTFEQTFESTALIMSGPLANSYLGSVRWGYRSDEHAVSNLVPLAIVEQGTPSAAFNAAAQKWNSAVLPDRANPGTTYDTVDLPIDNQRRPSEMPTIELLTKLTQIDAEIAAAAGPARMQKELEKRGLENEARTRHMRISVKVNATEDWIGSDETYCRVIGPHGTVTTPVHDLKKGQSFVFDIALGAALPGTGALTIQVFDQDWPDSDDLLVSMTMPAPFAPVTNTATMDGANYNVTASFA
ncbi:eCIS core domain-containing protein [Caballeronia humi]|uniref:eCIS core domain-containing protein n=1 Tax=Caballeronia humi TaxID=326474 RepID=A0A158G6N6_9BURK|nr:DUF4157 domain-containing protein [Caballeronia humi]SAL27778.1 hypothetical protein AWB65_01631 [Caballeronia humi]